MEVKNRKIPAVSLCVTALLFIMLILSVSSMRRKSLTVDELAHYRFGKKIIKGRLQAAEMQKMPVSVLNALPLHVLQKWNITASNRTAIFVSRIPTTLVALILAYFIFRWASSLYGEKAGVAALVCCVFCPTTLAHSRFMTNDLFCATLMLISTYVFVEYMKKPSLQRWILTAVIFSLAQLTKHTALLLFPIFILLCVLHSKNGIRKFFQYKNLRSSVRKFGRFAGYLLLFVLIFLVVLNAGYGFRDVCVSFSQLAGYNPDLFREPLTQTLLQRFPRVPLPLPRTYLESLLLGYHYNAKGLGHGSVYLFEELSRKGWWYYFPVAAVLKFPISFFLMFGGAVWAWINNRKRRKDPAGLSVFLPALVIFLFFTLFCTAQIGIRYLLPMLPFLYIFISQIVTLDAPTMKFAWRLGIPLLFVWFALSSLSYYPHYLSYFNELIGRRTNMYKYLADSNVDWGQNQYYLDKYVRDNPRKNIKVSPPKPASGTVIISVNELVGIVHGPQKYRWIRTRYRPVGHIAYSWLIFDIPEEPHQDP